jgi:predicted HAD superfamily phosphohydrolase YqeG
MPITYELKDQLLTIRTQGDFEQTDLSKMIHEIFKDPVFEPGIKILVHDLDSVYIPTSQDIETGAKNMEQFMKKFSAKLALVVSSNVNFGMGRMLETYCESRDINVKVFKDLEKAHQWLEEE